MTTGKALDLLLSGHTLRRKFWGDNLSMYFDKETHQFVTIYKASCGQTETSRSSCIEISGKYFVLSDWEVVE